MENTQRFSDLLGDQNVREFAKRIGHSHTAVYRWVNEESVPSIGAVPTIAEALEMDPTDLLFVFAAAQSRIMARRKAA